MTLSIGSAATLTSMHPSRPLPIFTDEMASSRSRSARTARLDAIKSYLGASGEPIPGSSPAAENAASAALARFPFCGSGFCGIPTRVANACHGASLWASTLGPSSRQLPAPEMKVLIVAFAFPPSNLIGAIRAGKLARYLDRRGHDVRALTTDIVDDRSLPLEISRERVIYTDYLERKGWLERLTHPFRSRSASQLANRSEAAPMQGGGLRRSLR